VGILSQIRLLQSKKGPMCFATLETLNQKMDLVFFPKVFEAYKNILKEKEFVLIESKESSQEKGKFFVEKFFIFDDFLKTAFQGVKIYLRDQFENVKNILVDHKGLIPVHLILERPEGKFRIPLEREYDISLSKEVIIKLLVYGVVEFF
jgi:DNA polymerase-3 subunit alpha